GLVVGLLPSWGNYWKTTEDNLFNVENALQYGQYLSNRYRNKPIIWILGGDAFVENEEEEAILHALARGLRAGQATKQLITFHPRGPGRSSDVFHEAEWLDVNMFHSSHAGRGFDNGLFVTHDRQLTPPKPTLDGEPRYENLVVGFYYRGNNRMDKFTDDDTRTAAYQSLLAGACGHAYGNNNIWQIWVPGEENYIGARIPWYEAMDHPGAFDMTRIRRLFESRPFHLLRPAQDMLVDAPRQGPDKVRAALASDGSFAFVYSPTGQPFTLDTDLFAETLISAYWYNPRYGSAFLFQEGTSQAIKTYHPPTNGHGHDWVLVLDVKRKNYGIPGQ
ncbi:MAG: glycoside hydrolase family 140 protein, partial [Bacteroidota bacterium]